MEKFTVKYRDMLYESLDDRMKDKLSDKYLSFKRGVLLLIEDSIDTKELVDVQNFIDKYYKGEDKDVLVGFVNDADIFNVYLKFQGDIDELCNDKNYFKDSPEKNNVFSLYDFIIDGTKFAVKEIMNIFLAELFTK